jgi:hypothetical protein
MEAMVPLSIVDGAGGSVTIEMIWSNYNIACRSVKAVVEGKGEREQ